MKIKKVITTYWFWGIFLTLLVIGGLVLEWYPLQTLEYKAYDLMSALKKSETAGPVVIVAIDEESIKDIGQWPWPRTYIADLITRLSRYRAKIIGLHILYPDKELNEGLTEIRDIRKGLEQEKKLLKIPGVARLYKSLKKAERKVNGDADLTLSLRSSKKVVLPLLFTLGGEDDKAGPKVSRVLRRNSLKAFTNIDITAGDITAPLPAFAANARAIGHMNLVPDGDGVIRSVPLLVQYEKRLFPSFALQVALKYLNYRTKRLKEWSTKVTHGLKIGDVTIPTDKNYRMFIGYNVMNETFPFFSYTDVMNDKVPAKTFKNKIVLIGDIASAIAPQYKTPVRNQVPAVRIAANVIENILNNHHVVRPRWASYAELGIILYLGLFLSFIIPKVKSGVGAMIMGIFLFTAVSLSVFLLMTFGYWLKIVSAVLLATFGYGVVVSKRYLFTDKKRELLEAESAETNKMLGLSFQGQGMLDMAFEKFKKCPINDKSVKELLYNLGLDFERKRMYNKAIVLYEYILQAGKFKDIKEKIDKLKAVGETMLFGAGAHGKDGTVLVNDATTRPTLGRYEIVEELGRGAMGTVYLGKDPKINRDVAVKTLKYEDVGEDEIKEVKNRFFIEAEAAGKLAHPHIVTIYDAGEDYDVTYMAMELLDGKDLSAYCSKDSLLPVKEVLRVIASVAEALDYAHGKGIVHRDIKPGNIMLLKNKNVKVTDFGIARITAASRTQTGIVLGTPSYMSPEQVAGQKVDGRSDLFSLGVVFFELLTGEKPFKGDSIASVMYNITNVVYPSLKQIAPKTPDCCVEIIDKLLTKSVNKRYKTGRALADDIKKCMEKV